MPTDLTVARILAMAIRARLTLGRTSGWYDPTARVGGPAAILAIAADPGLADGRWVGLVEIQAATGLSEEAAWGLSDGFNGRPAIAAEGWDGDRYAECHVIGRETWAALSGGVPTYARM